MPIVSATSVALNSRIPVRNFGVHDVPRSLCVEANPPSIFGLRPNARPFPELSLLEGEGAQAHYVIFISSAQCESYREFEAGAGGISFAAV